MSVTLHPSGCLCCILNSWRCVLRKISASIHPSIPQQGSHKNKRPTGRGNRSMLISTQMLKTVQNTNELAYMKAKRIIQPRWKIISQQDQGWIPVDKVAGGTNLMVEVEPWDLWPPYTRLTPKITKTRETLLFYIQVATHRKGLGKPHFKLPNG